ncbi:MAG: Eukaryotic translation initiation factor eIF2A, partial [Actinomycetota bacterium]|nr:Eukaryotic translation initiation factor eIF2A [Actinomycetota bacterium]
MAAAVTRRRTVALIFVGVFVAGCGGASDHGSKPVVSGRGSTTVSTSKASRPVVTGKVSRPVVTSKVSRSVVTGDVRLFLPLGDYRGVAWLTANRFVIERHRLTEGPAIFELWAGRPDSTNFRKLNVRADPRCRLDDVLAPYRLGGGRLGAVRECNPKNADSPVVRTNTLVAIDLATGASTKLASLAPISPAIRESHASQGDDVVTHIAWDPDMRHAIGSSTSNCGTLVRITPSGTAPLDLQVGPSGHMWNTADPEVANPSTSDCDTKYGTVGGVTAGPGNRRIAFHASARYSPAGAPTNAPAPGVVSVWDRRTNKVTNIVDHVAGVTGTAWSPTGRWIAFAGDPGRRGDGLWLVDPAGKHLTRIAAR